MPPVSNRKPKLQQKKKSQIESITCASCGLPKKPTEFYNSSSVFHAGTGKVPYCKICLKNMSVDSNSNIDIEKFKNVLKEIDKPYIHDVLQSAYNQADKEKNGEGDAIGNFFKNINSLPQYKKLTWVDSIFEIVHEDEENYSNNSILDFTITDKIIDKWGYGYSNEEYYYFEKKWKKLIDNYGEKTSLHTEGLITYIRFRVKEELATAKGDVKEAKEWASLASTSAKDAKLNVSQLSKSDISGGVELLPQLFEAVESEIGIIPTLPYLKEQPYDDADLIIWFIVNYLRRLEDKSRITYREIWNFYDEMLNEFFMQQGYNEEAIKNEKLKRNNVFRDLGKVYKEPIYEESDV